MKLTNISKEETKDQSSILGKFRIQTDSTLDLMNSPRELDHKKMSKIKINSKLLDNPDELFYKKNEKYNKTERNQGSIEMRIQENNDQMEPSDLLEILNETPKRFKKKKKNLINTMNHSFGAGPKAVTWEDNI
mmetsp:Transcript_25115/g.22266  ORF Transcript_25115/g.22266 Transcript_25115/m.22266 type:complete len:133 (+) Transcript_25115:339-737(+)